VWSRRFTSARELRPEGRNVDVYSEDQGDGKTYSDLLHRPDIDAVVIALPIHVQEHYIKPALSAGKHVLSEKPIAKDTLAATELLDYYHTAMAASHITWAVAENARFLDAFHHARREIENLGRITGFKVEMFFNVGTDHKVLSVFSLPLTSAS